MLGSFTTMPLPLENTSVFAVPKSMARSDENKLKTDRKLYPLFDIFPLRLRPHYPLSAAAARPDHLPRNSKKLTNKFANDFPGIV
jgi:hypothetical protein